MVEPEVKINFDRKHTWVWTIYLDCLKRAKTMEKAKDA